MNHLTKKYVVLMIAVLFILIAAGCSGNKANGDGEKTDIGEAVDYTITGIEPGAGITVTTEKALKEYDNLKGWDVEEASTAAMMEELGKAIDKEEPIVVTGWNPHWMFAKYPDMKYLDDPKGVYGETEVIKTLARKGLKEDKPEAYKLLDQFQWEVEDMEDIMYEATKSGADIDDVAKEWVEENPDKVDEWTKGVDDVDGEEIELVSTPWDSERASSGVVAEVLRSKGFDVTVTPVDVAVVFKSVANGDGDATLAAWMPMTHKDFYDKYDGQFEDLGENLKGAKIGLVVPDYMDIDSIEDLEPK
ncbi:glycine betaine ABC transporter substrate-binding protein [Lentibacillus sp. L22]|uniref:glycine betaine ABC transporter substrate-binding protein n=1 Tax=Lentibacillus TaxID=175304 RepID=UPI0022B1DC68|nr:glycine betaine ABC transporter substrate-binding protein [Lentibacillus daqui]